MRLRERNRRFEDYTDGNWLFRIWPNGDLQTRAAVPTYVSTEHRDMETQAERLRDTDTEFTFHWESTRMRLVIMLNSTVSVSVWQRYYLYTYACCTYCRCSAHCAIHPQVLRWPLKKRRNSTENNSTYPATRPVQLERSGVSWWQQGCMLSRVLSCSCIHGTDLSYNQGSIDVKPLDIFANVAPYKHLQ